MALDRDQSRDFGDGRAQGLFQPELERGQLCRAGGAASQENHAHSAIVVDSDPLDVASVCDQGRPQLVEVAFDGLSQRISRCSLRMHDLRIGISSAPL